MHGPRPKRSLRAYVGIRGWRLAGYSRAEVCDKDAVLDLPLPVLATILGAVGAAAGSFVALVSLRLPAGRPFGAVRSMCAGCGAVLQPHELVPLLSFAVQRGRCRGCAAAIPWRYPAVEAAAAAIGVAAALALPDPRAAVAVAALGWTLLLLALLDAEHFWLPSAVTLPLSAAGLAVTTWLAPADLPVHAIGAAVGYLSFAGVAALYKAVRGRTGLGGGDAKLFAASGAWLGWEALPLVLLAAAVSGIVVALLLWRRGITATTRLPFGVFLAAATWIVALAGYPASVASTSPSSAGLPVATTRPSLPRTSGAPVQSVIAPPAPVTTGTSAAQS